ncbi:hypothetical protein WR25_12986 [Diploscapter pachys]|uniref:DUF19 domain-containing protein n=1 Tax=Diploscapter pachys TaxID=2018661 RepID=A0A2A2LK52_9BILA|nr:hypothetical protein WR25_12986 [Diploscapter pachys]
MGYNKLALFIAISSLIALSYAQTQRDKAIAKVLKMTGIKLSDYQLNEKTVVKGLQCIEPTIIDILPYDGTSATDNKLYKAAMNCVTKVATLGTASIAANFMSQWNGCIKPSNATCLAAKVKPKAMKALGKPYNELSAIAMKCRTNNAGQSGMYEKCANKVYEKALAYVYKDYVDQSCLKLAKAINVAEYNCCRKMVDLVVKKDVSGKYSCYSKAQPLAGNTPTCPK